MQTAILFVVSLTVIFGIHAWRSSRSGSLLDQWARENEFDILHSEYRYVSRGPFFWTTSQGQTVYYVVVQDRHGTQRRGYVRCGSWFLGIMSDRAEVRWEDDRNA